MLRRHRQSTGSSSFGERSNFRCRVVDPARRCVYPNSMGTQDADWMERWRRGEAAAFEALVERWRRPVARFLFRCTGRADLVQDLCQEVFLRVYQAGPRYREAGAFPGWLFRIALNMVRD